MSKELHADPVVADGDDTRDVWALPGDPAL